MSATKAIFNRRRLKIGNCYVPCTLQVQCSYFVPLTNILFPTGMTFSLQFVEWSETGVLPEVCITQYGD